MRSLFFLILFSTVIFMSAWYFKPAVSVPVAHIDSLSPVETKQANSDYKPAFYGQTRVQGVKTTTPYKIEKIAENIGKPWAITLLPDSRWIVTDKSGFMTIYSADGKLLK